MINYISGLVFVVLLMIGAAIVAPFAEAHPVTSKIIGTAWLVTDMILASAIQLAAQGQRAVVFRLASSRRSRDPDCSWSSHRSTRSGWSTPASWR